MAGVYVFLADGFEEIEGLTVVDLLRRAKQEVCMVSIMGRLEINGSHGIRVQADALYEDTSFSKEDMLVLPGGLKGTQNLAAYEPLAGLLKEHNSADGRIAAICAAPSVLGGLGLLNGKEAVCYPGFEEKLTGAKCGMKKAVTDGNITTSRGLGTAIPFALELISLLCGEQEASDIKKSIVYGHEN